MFFSKLDLVFYNSRSFLYLCMSATMSTAVRAVENASYAWANTFLTIASGFSIDFECPRSPMQDSPFSRDTSTKVSLTVEILVMVELLGRSVI